MAHLQISAGFASWQRYCTASSSGRQPNFAALNRLRHLCSAGRPSRWALAHISSSVWLSLTLYLYYLLYMYEAVPTMVDCWAKTPTVATPPQTVEYFYGRISRQEAEKYLGNGRDGLFLLRWCINHANGYGIAVYFHSK